MPKSLTLLGQVEALFANLEEEQEGRDKRNEAERKRVLNKPKKKIFPAGVNSGEMKSANTQLLILKELQGGVKDIKSLMDSTGRGMTVVKTTLYKMVEDNLVERIGKPGKRAQFVLIDLGSVEEEE